MSLFESRTMPFHFFHSRLGIVCLVPRLSATRPHSSRLHHGRHCPRFLNVWPFPIRWFPSRIQPSKHNLPLPKGNAGRNPPPKSPSSTAAVPDVQPAPPSTPCLQLSLPTRTQSPPNYHRTPRCRRNHTLRPDVLFCSNPPRR